MDCIDKDDATGVLSFFKWVGKIWFILCKVYCYKLTFLNRYLLMT